MDKKTRLREAALHYHEFPQPGKVAIAATKQMVTQYDLALAYSPGVAAPCEEIQANPAAAYNSAGSQFFILHADAKYLDKDYAAFGMVTEGMDTVDAIATCVTGVQSKPIVEQKVKTIRVETFGEEIGEPETIED